MSNSVKIPGAVGAQLGQLRDPFRHEGEAVSVCTRRQQQKLAWLLGLL